MRIASPGQAVFAAAMVWLGILGLMAGDFAPIWQPTPGAMPAREILVYLSAATSLAGGAGLLWRRAAHAAAGLLLVYLLVWLLLSRGPPVVRAPASQDTWSGLGETAVIVAAAWVLFAQSAKNNGRPRFATGDAGLRIARGLYGLALIPFGVAHFHFARQTAALVPAWLPCHLALAYLTGGAFIAAGVSMLSGMFARLAATLSALQIGLFTLLVWGPVLAAGSRSPFAWSEAVISITLTASAWVVAESYRGAGWLATRRW